MCYRPLLLLPDEEEYREEYEATYCDDSPLFMHDGMEVQFFADRFGHAFFRDRDRRGNTLDPPVFEAKRAERLHWIQACLEDDTLENYRRVMDNGSVWRLVLLPAEPYVVVLRTVCDDVARFWTAYVVDSARALTNIQSNPRW